MKLTLNGSNKNKDGGGGVSIITLPPDVDTEKQLQNNQCDVTTPRSQGVKSRRVWTVVLAIWTVVTIVVVSTAAWQISQQYRADTFHEEEEQDKPFHHHHPHHPERLGPGRMPHGNGPRHHPPPIPGHMPHHPPPPMPPQLEHTNFPPFIAGHVQGLFNRLQSMFHPEDTDMTGSEPSRDATGNNQNIVQIEVACSSINYYPARCQVQGQIEDIKVKDQLSTPECKVNHSFFTRGNILEVSHGCRAVFTVSIKVKEVDGSEISELLDRHHGDTKVTCSSVDFRPVTCEVRGQIVGIRVIEQLSQAECKEGQSFMAAGNLIHVYHGCRAVFTVKVMA